MGTLLTILKLFPLIVDAVKAIEEAAPIGGIGGDKLNLILDMIKQLGGEVSGLIEPITKVIGLVVSFFNKVGVFNKPQ